MFFKKTAEGKVIKVYANIERYLRDDISCGVNGGRACDATAQTVLSRSGRALGTPPTKCFPTGHISCPILMYFLHRYTYEYEVVPR
ncbi:hypothetical protein BDR05DRAFT_80892 [Suillus weaverae]|nr:hypothetical protein BDR05DRAFT_80892 [Suillus weaverae]